VVTILDRYIARQFLINIIALTFMLGAFIVLIDVSLNVDDYLNRARKSGMDGGVRTFITAAFLVVDLWWPRLIQLFTYISGLILVGAMGFTFAQLSRHREFVAMMAGGISLFRVARPVMLVASFVMLGQVVVQEVALPHLAPLLARSIREAGNRDFAAFAVRLVPDGQGRVLMAKHFDPSSQAMQGVYILERDEVGNAVSRITAERATWDGTQWTLENGLQRSLTISQMDPNDPSTATGKVITRVSLGLDPTALLAQRYRTFSQSLSWRQLLDAMSLPDVSDELRSELQRIGWGRLATVVSALVTLLVAMPFFLTREPKNIVTQSLKCAPVALGCLLGGVLGAAAPVPPDLIPVPLAVFVPVLAMLPVAIVQMTSIRT
jgi:lipopolysaccharide export system permease protein